MSQTPPKTEQTNMVFLAGKLKFDPKRYESNASCLIDVGQKAAIQCGVYIGNEAPAGNEAIADKLLRFREGDFIKVVAMLRPYGVKKDDKWKNSISIDITEIKNEAPRRQPTAPKDDDIPF